MAEKFGRNYTLTIQRPVPFLPLVIQRPFTIDFDVTRRNWGSPSIGKITIYNLAADSRNSILKTMYNYSDQRNVTLDAGYGTSLRTILSGNIYTCNVQRVGVNYMSMIESYDGGAAYQNSFVNLNFSAGTRFSVIVQALASSLSAYGVTVKFIDNFDYLGTTNRAYICSGNAIDRIKDIVGDGGAVYIDNMQITVKQVNTSLPMQSLTLPIISSDSGLIGTPVLESTLITFQMIFEPSLFVGQEIYLQSGQGVPQAYSGVKQITTLNHRGTISDAVCGEAITTVTVYAPGAPKTTGGVI